MTPDQKSVLDILERNVGRAAKKLESDATLIELGIDSLKFIMLILEIEQALGRPVFNMESVGQLRTVGDLLMLMETKQQ